MSSQPDVRTAEVGGLPDEGVRYRSENCRSIHRQDPDADEPEPACQLTNRDGAECIPAEISRLLPFGRWSLCQNPECFGGDDTDLDRGDGIETDGGRPSDHYLDTAGDALETAYEEEDGWEKEAIVELRKDLAGLQGFEVPSEVATDGSGREIVLRGFDPENAKRIESLLDESLRLEIIAIRRDDR